MNKYREALREIIKIHDGLLVDGDYWEAIENILHPLRVKKCKCKEGRKYAEVNRTI